MNTIELSLIIAAGSLLAGFLGALTGLGGGVVNVPMLTLAFGIDIRYAIDASLISGIATSSGAAAAYVKEGYSNIRVGMFLEVATTVGAITGAAIALRLPLRVIAVIFGVVLMYSAYLSWRQEQDSTASHESDRLAKLLRLDGTFPAANGLQHYEVQGVPLGFGLMYLAGMLSGMLGIGSGAVKVLAMDKAMKLPFKVSTTTSNFMIGVTAAASAGIYLSRGYIDPALAMPVMLGVLAGSLAGAKILIVARTRTLRLVFSIVIAALAIEMIFQGVRGKL